MLIRRFVLKKLLTLASMVFLFGCMEKDVKLSGEYELINAPLNAQITISFDGNKFAGTSGVNRYFGTFEQNGNAIKFSTAGLTMMMGPEDLMQAEQKYLKDLSEVDKVSVENGKLALTGDNNIALEFKLK